MKERTFWPIIILVFFSALLTSCGKLTVPEAEEKLQAYLDRVVSEDAQLLNAVLLVDSESKGLHWAGASGLAVPESGTAMTAQHPFLIASVTKSFTSVTVAMLHEKGLLDFEDFIAPYLLEDIISDLHVLDGEDYSDVISIQHLLNHTSGLPDYFTLQPESGPSFIDLVLEEPSHFWAPEEMIQFSKENLKPLFAPGDGFHYSDTNYQLLGLIIEKVTGKQLHKVFQEYIWEPLEMSHTYLHLRSEPTDPSTLEMAHLILNGVDVTNFTSLSAAWADGGIVSTVEDLRTFIYALLHNLLIQQETMRAMQTWIPNEKGIYYGFGLMLFKLPELSPFLFSYPDIWGHPGSTGSYLYYCPELDTVLAGTMNQSEYEEEHINVLLKVLDIIVSIN